MVEQVVDFSQAQKVGFQDAYMEVFNCHDKNVALSKLHGCKWHYLQAVTRIQKNRKIVKLKQVVRVLIMIECFLFINAFYQLFY